jgi:tRNA-splicing ligase RtcB
MNHSYELIKPERGGTIKAWVQGVAYEDSARRQVENTAALPFIHRHIAVMPDVHYGRGATIGSVIPTVGAIVPAAVGVDLGCGMQAVRTTLTAKDLPDNLRKLRLAIEKAVPVGRGAWKDLPGPVRAAWERLLPRFEAICEHRPQLARANALTHLGTLGGGNHFIEICLDETERVWVMLHSGSRGIGNAIGTYYIELAKEEMRKHDVHLPDQDLAYLREGSKHFDRYVAAVEWAQDFARESRRLMMAATLQAMRSSGLPPFSTEEQVVDCHHNYVSREHHLGADCLVTRKGA